MKRKMPPKISSSVYVIITEKERLEGNALLGIEYYYNSDKRGGES